MYHLLKILSVSFVLMSQDVYPQAIVNPLMKTTICSTGTIPPLDCANKIDNGGTPEDGRIYIVFAMLHSQACTSHPNNKDCREEVTSQVQAACDVDQPTCTIDFAADINESFACFGDAARNRVLSITWTCLQDPCKGDATEANECGAVSMTTCSNLQGLKFTCTP